MPLSGRGCPRPGSRDCHHLSEENPGADTRAGRKETDSFSRPDGRGSRGVCAAQRCLWWPGGGPARAEQGCPQFWASPPQVCGRQGGGISSSGGTGPGHPHWPGGALGLAWGPQEERCWALVGAANSRHASASCLCPPGGHTATLKATLCGARAQPAAATEPAHPAGLLWAVPSKGSTP